MPVAFRHSTRLTTNPMKMANTVRSGLVLWITFPDFLSRGWIAQQEMAVLNTIEKIYEKALPGGRQQAHVFPQVLRKGSTIVVRGIEPKVVIAIQKALRSRGMDVSLRTVEQVDDSSR